MRFKWGKSSKRSRQEKATPTMAVRASPDSPRRQHRKRGASETRCAQTADASLSVSGTGDAAPSNGEFTATATAQATATATATPTHKQPQRSLRGTSRATATV